MERATVTIGRAGSVIAVVAAIVAVLIAVTFHDDPFISFLAALAVAVLSVPVAGAAAVRTAPRNAVSWILLAAGVTLPVAIAAFCCSRAVFDDGHELPFAGLAGWLDGWPWVPATMLVATVGILLFPDGRLPTPRWRPLLVTEVVVAALLLVATLFGSHLLDWPNVPNPTRLSGEAGVVAGELLLAIALVAPMSTLSAIALTRRYRSAGDPVARIRLRSVLPAAWLIVASWWGCIGVGIFGGDTITLIPAESIGILALGIGCWVAIRRYGLFDARLAVRRGLVYGALTVLVAVVYVAVAALLTAFGAGLLAAPVAVAIAVVAALPVRDRLQWAANRLVFGLRDDPFATFVRLGDDLERAAAADEVLPAAVSSVRETLKLRYVAIRSADGELLAEAGTPGHAPAQEVPLVFTGERVGALIAQPSDDDGPLGAGTRELLTRIARPIATATGATSLGRDLLASRERLVAATEEERRRLRRDLHDGLGPTLSSAVLETARARALLERDPDAAIGLLDQLTAQLQTAVADVRRLVYGLRPPALDELGLVGALGEQALALGGIRVTGPREQIGLGAAVEVAAYRIAMEAMTNATRHAQSRQVTVDVSIDRSGHDCLRLEIADDGVGLPDGYRAGVGITSMRERAAELGGLCTVERREPHGTLVRAVVPLGST